MARYIDKDKLIKICNEKGHEYFKDVGIFATAAIRTIKDIIANAPEVNLKEERHGTWLEDEKVDSSVLYCSVCGHWCVHNRFFYCPNCGARMDGDEK